MDVSQPKRGAVEHHGGEGAVRCDSIVEGVGSDQLKQASKHISGLDDCYILIPERTGLNSSR